MSKCEICGVELQIEIIDITDEIPHFICLNCAKQRHSCNFCTHGVGCSFEEDPSPLPKLIVKTMQKDNMTMQAKISNPERIEITCKKDCFCFEPEFGCLRQFNTCGNHAFRWPGGQHA